MKRRWIAAGALAVLTGLALLNASSLAPRPGARPRIIAQHGVHQLYRPGPVDDTACTAGRILPPRHRLIENTLPSIRAAFDAGADVVEIDVRPTRDGDFMVFHDDGLDCRTNGHGRVRDHAADELKTLDVGYGYTADGGRTYPLRGAGVGLMPTLGEALAAFPDRDFLIQLKDGGAEAQALARYLQARKANPGRLAFFGSPDSIAAIKALQPGWRTWTFKRGGACSLAYMALGWTGYVPRSCDGGAFVAPLNLRWLLWGWPDRLTQRMRAHGAEVLVIGRLERPGPTGFTRLDSPAELRAVPARFDGALWTDRIEVVGPAAAKR